MSEPTNAPMFVPLLERCSANADPAAEMITARQYFNRIEKSIGDKDSQEGLEVLLLLQYQSVSSVTSFNSKGRPIFPPAFMDAFFSVFSTNEARIKAFSNCYLYGYLNVSNEIWDGMRGPLRVNIDDYNELCSSPANRFEDDELEAAATKILDQLHLPRYKQIHYKKDGSSTTMSEYPRWLLDGLDWMGRRNSKK